MDVPERRESAEKQSLVVWRRVLGRKFPYFQGVVKDSGSAQLCRRSLLHVWGVFCFGVFGVSVGDGKVGKSGGKVAR